jgi:hypothetical protein
VHTYMLIFEQHSRLSFARIEVRPAPRFHPVGEQHATGLLRLLKFGETPRDDLWNTATRELSP